MMRHSLNEIVPTFDWIILLYYGYEIFSLRKDEFPTKFNFGSDETKQEPNRDSIEE